jgi:hypothetical protein
MIVVDVIGLPTDADRLPVGLAWIFHPLGVLLVPAAAYAGGSLVAWRLGDRAFVHRRRHRGDGCQPPVIRVAARADHPVGPASSGDDGQKSVGADAGCLSFRVTGAD